MFFRFQREGDAAKGIDVILRGFFEEGRVTSRKDLPAAAAESSRVPAPPDSQKFLPWRRARMPMNHPKSWLSLSNFALGFSVRVHFLAQPTMTKSHRTISSPTAQ